MNNMSQTSLTPSSSLTLRELEAQITELAGHLNAANHRWLMLIAEFDRREGWGGDGATQSCAHWLSWKCGIAHGAAREKVRVARALEALPLVSASMSRGELSYSKVRALTRVATPATEETLLMIALHGTAHHVETVVRQFRRAREAVELGREAQQFASRKLSYFYDEDGSLVLNARLPAESGALLVKALELATEDAERSHVPAGTSGSDDGLRHPPQYTSNSRLDSTGLDETGLDASGLDASGLDASWLDASRLDTSAIYTSAPDHPEPESTITQRRADALALFAESFLKHGHQPMNGGERQQIVVHVDAQTLKNASAGRCELENGPALSVQTVRRLCCDASLVTMIEDENGEPLNVGRKTRSIPPAIRRALRARDKGCTFPGCTHTRYLDGHHVRHWADGGETKLSNLLMLCRFHHRQVHEGRVRVRMLDDGAVRFTGSNGEMLMAVHPSTGSADALVSDNCERAERIDPQAAVTRWCGERMDHGMAVGGLVDQWQREKAQDVPAGTPSSFGMTASIRQRKGSPSQGDFDQPGVSQP